jgi:hypothetical protein
MNLIEKIKILYKAKEPLTQIAAEVKDAPSKWKQVHFWVMVFASIAALVAALEGALPTRMRANASTSG